MVGIASVSSRMPSRVQVKPIALHVNLNCAYPVSLFARLLYNTWVAFATRQSWWLVLVVLFCLALWISFQVETQGLTVQDSQITRR